VANPYFFCNIIPPNTDVITPSPLNPPFLPPVSLYLSATNREFTLASHVYLHGAMIGLMPQILITKIYFVPISLF